ncbi:MAG: alpha/beta fold hydrolase [Candidatus Bipolaricaulia bacterium]
MEETEMLKEQSFNTGVVAINYAEGPPSGPPLILLHGFTARWQGLLPIIPALSMRWHIYALDFRGHGKSDRAPGQYRPQDYSADFMAFLQHQVTEPAALFGHSAGGTAALWLAAQLPNKVQALVVADAPISIERLVEADTSYWAALRDLIRSGRSVAELASALADVLVSVPGQDTWIRYGDLPGVDAVRLRAWAKTLSQVDPQVLEFRAEGRTQKFLRNFNIDTVLQRISCPVLLLQGNPSLGGIMTDHEVEHALSVLPDASHVLIEHAGHDLGLSTWEVAPLLRAVTNFLESL